MWVDSHRLHKASSKKGLRATGHLRGGAPTSTFFYSSGNAHTFHRNLLHQGEPGPVLGRRPCPSEILPRSQALWGFSMRSLIQTYDGEPTKCANKTPCMCWCVFTGVGGSGCGGHMSTSKPSSVTLWLDSDDDFEIGSLTEPGAHRLG